MSASLSHYTPSTCDRFRGKKSEIADREKIAQSWKEKEARVGDEQKSLGELTGEVVGDWPKNKNLRNTICEEVEQKGAECFKKFPASKAA